MKKAIAFFLILLAPSISFGLTFGPFTQISPTGGNGVPPLLAVSSNGNAFAAWIDYPNILQIAYFNNAPGGGWIAATLAIGASAPQIGIDGSGNAFVVWVSQSQGINNTQIIVSRFTVASPTVPVLTAQLSATGTLNSSPVLAVSSSGIAVVAWLQSQPFAFLSKSFNPVANAWGALATVLPVLPASMSLDNFGNGFAIINSQPQGIIQVSRINAP
jgi:hypothetical protein